MFVDCKSICRRKEGQKKVEKLGVKIKNYIFNNENSQIQICNKIYTW